jgi:hypothetical protein
MGEKPIEISDKDVIVAITRGLKLIIKLLEKLLKGEKI